MTTLNVHKRPETTALQLIALLAMLQLAVALLSNGFVLSFDESLWQYIGRNWFRNGLVPYSGGVDNQSPLIFALFGLSDKLFGVNYWFPRTVGVLFQAAGMYYVYKIADRLSGKQAGLLAVSFYGLSLMWHAGGGKYSSYTETFEVTFIIISVYYYLIAQNKKDYLLSGCLAGIGLGFRISAFFAIGALFISLLRKSRTNTLLFCGGVVLSFGCLLLWAALAGINLHTLYNYAFADNFNSGSPYDHTPMWKLEQFTEKFFYTEIILFYPMIIGYWMIRKEIDLFTLLLGFALAGIAFIGEFTWIHLKELLPALSLMSALAVSYLVNNYKVPIKQVMIITWIVFFPKLLEPLLNLKALLKPDVSQQAAYNRPPYTWPDEGTRKKLGWWVKDHTTPRQKVFVAGFGSQIQVYSERQSVYFNEMQTPLAKRELYKDLLLNKPYMILVPLFPEYKQYIGPDLRRFVDNLVAKNYNLMGNMYSYGIYVKKQADTPQYKYR